jgi:hypothetical protein
VAFYSAIRKNGTMWFEDKWVQLEGIMFREVSQAQKVNAACFLFYVGGTDETSIKNIMKNRLY